IPLKGWSARRLISRLNSGGGSMTGLPSERSYTFSAPNCFFMAMPSSNIRLIQDPTSMPFLTLSDTATLDFLSPVLKRLEVDFTEVFRQEAGDAFFPDIYIQRGERRETPQHEQVERPDVAQLLGLRRPVHEVD